MTEDEIAEVRASFARLAADGDGFAADFYARLFARAPDVRPLFPADLAGQGGKLVAMLALVVRGLGDLAPLLLAIDALGARHARYGVRPAHFAAVGTALVETLAARLGSDFTPAAAAGWGAAYALLSARMIAALQPVPA